MRHHQHIPSARPPGQASGASRSAALPRSATRILTPAHRRRQHTSSTQLCLQARLRGKASPSERARTRLNQRGPARASATCDSSMEASRTCEVSSRELELEIAPGTCALVRYCSSRGSCGTPAIGDRTCNSNASARQARIIRKSHSSCRGCAPSAEGKGARQEPPARSFALPTLPSGALHPPAQPPATACLPGCWRRQLRSKARVNPSPTCPTHEARTPTLTRGRDLGSSI